MVGATRLPGQDDHCSVIVAAEKARTSAFFSHLGDCEGDVLCAEQVSEDIFAMLPALELYFNACATFPEADALLTYGLATTAHSELATQTCAFSVVTLEPTDALQFFVSDLIEKYHAEVWFAQMLRGVLSYVARDGGQGVCPTRLIAAYALQNDDAELLEVFVDFRTRAPFYRIGKRRTPETYEAVRLRAASAAPTSDSSKVSPSWSGLHYRVRAAVLMTAAKADGDTAINRSHRKVSALREKYALPQQRDLPVKQVNFLYEVLGIERRKSIVKGTLGKPLELVTPSYDANTCAKST